MRINIHTYHFFFHENLIFGQMLTFLNGFIRHSKSPFSRWTLSLSSNFGFSFQVEFETPNKTLTNEHLLGPRFGPSWSSSRNKWSAWRKLFLAFAMFLTARHFMKTGTSAKCNCLCSFNEFSTMDYKVLYKNRSQSIYRLHYVVFPTKTP